MIYIKPQVEIIEIADNDIITTSPGTSGGGLVDGGSGGDFTGGGGNFEWN